MKAKYIPGDFVMTNGVPLGTAKGVVYRVTACDPSKTLELDDGTILKGTVCLENIKGASIGDKGFLMGDCCAWVKDIVPIELTTTILEKNGWKEDDGDYVNEDHYLRLCEKYEGYVLYKVVNEKVVWLMDIDYVHTLQHLLFGLGLDNRLDM